MRRFGIPEPAHFLTFYLQKGFLRMKKTNLYFKTILLFLLLFTSKEMIAEILLEDNFNSLNSGDINTDLGDRQSGSAAVVSYQWWTGGNTPSVTNEGPYAGMA